MKEIEKRSLSLLMAVLIMVSALALPAGAASDSIELAGPITTKTVSAKVAVSGYDQFKGGYLILTAGPASQGDADSRAQVGLVSFTGAGDYTVTIKNTFALKKGETVMAHLYKYDSVNDRTMFKYGNHVEITEAAEKLSAAISGEINTASESITVEIKGTIPAGARLLVKSFGPDEPIVLAGGTLAGAAEAAASVSITPDKAAMKAGNKLAAFVLNAGKLAAQSSPVLIAEKVPEAEGTIELAGPITTKTVSAEVTVTGYDNFKDGYLILTAGPASQGDTDSRARLGSVSFTGADKYTVAITNTAALKKGETVMAHLYKYDSVNDRTMFRYGNHVEITEAEGPVPTPGTTPDEILANCSVTIMKNGQERTEDFKQNETSADIKVALDAGVEKCYLTVFSYASNTAFDPDSSQNIRLYSQFVKNGDEITAEFNKSFLPLKVGYSVIACLNVPVGPDWYKPDVSQALKIVDESGQGFEDYDPYPDAVITETALSAGAESLHISLNADARLFQAAKDGKTSLNIAVAQYPADASFDFESEQQTTLYSLHGVTAPIVNQEINLSEPLRAGHRVRAVVYWEQNTEIFLVKGNDYEAMFHRPDDSVLISGEIEKPAPVATIAGGVTPSSKSITVNVTGEIPAGARLLVKSFGADEAIALAGGKLVGAAEAAASAVITPAAGSLEEGRKLVAFVLNAGNIEAQSQPVVIGKDAPPAAEGTVNLAGPITTETKSVTVTVKGLDQFKGGYLIVTTGEPHQTDADSRTRLGSVSFTGDGAYTVNFSNEALRAGNTVLAHLYKYDSVNDRTMYKYGEYIEITEAGTPEPEKLSASVSGELTAETKQLTVTVKGEIPAGARVLVKAFAADEEIALAGGKLVGAAEAAASVKITPAAGSLTAGSRVVAFIVDKGVVKAQSEAVTVKGQEIIPDNVTVEITDKIVTKGDNRVNGIADWNRKLGTSARYTLYQFEGEKLDKNTALKLNEGTVNLSYPHMIMNVRDQLAVGAKLQIVLKIGGKEYLSNIITVGPSPDWGTPTAAIDAAYVNADAVSVPLIVNYDDRYLTMGDDFYCDITLYQIPGSVTDDEFLEKELWENPTIAKRIGQANSHWNDKTQGSVTVNILDGVKLVPGSKIIAKLRLPHTEWEGEEVDYLSLSVPVLDNGEKLPDPVAALLNLGEDTENGRKLRSILKDLNIKVKTLMNEDLDEKVGFIAGLPGYTETEGEYTDYHYNTEFMLMGNLSETQLDKLLAAMSEQDVYIGHKAMVVENTRDLAVYELLDIIADEHNEIIRNALEKMVEKAEALEEAKYGEHPDWNKLQTSVKAAKEILAQEKPATADMEKAYRELRDLYDSVTGNKKPEPETPDIGGSDNGDSEPYLPSQPVRPEMSFKDVHENDYFYEAVKWASEKGIAEGITDTEFDPEGICTRAQMITFIWRNAGSPEPQAKESIFADVAADACYAKAVIWAEENGITNGVSGSEFAPDAVCTRAQTVSFLYRQAKAEAKGGVHFADVAADAYYAEAVAWAYENDITEGTSYNTFSPDAGCTRAQVVTFLWRAETK